MREHPSKIFYGWWIVVASVAAWSMYGGLYVYGFSTFFLSLIREFGCSRALLSGAFSIAMLEGGILGPVGGFLIDRFGPRKMMMIGMSLMSAGFLLMSRVDSLSTFYLVFILCIAAGANLGVFSPTLVATANWFVRKRGRALGISLSGMGLGGLLVPVLGWIIAYHGWRIGAFSAGIFIFSMGIPLAMVMRHRPEEYGYLPDGRVPGTNVDAEELAEGGCHEDSEEDFTIAQAFRTRVFWKLALAFGFRQLVIHSVMAHMIPFLVGIGIRYELAAGMMGAIALISIMGRVGFGWLGDVIDKRLAISLSMLLLSVACLVLFKAQVIWQIVAVLAVFAIGHGGGAVLMFAIRAEYFGRRNIGTISGMMDMIQMFGVVIGPVFAGWMFDVTNSYRLVFLVLTVVGGVSMAIFLICNRPVMQEKIINQA